MVKKPPADAGDAGNMSSIPGFGRSPGGENSNPLYYSEVFFMKNSMDRLAWKAAVHGVAVSQP